jgi:hypothetical protein
MKKYLLFLATLFILSCSDEDYEDLNRDPNNPTEVSAENLFTASQKSLFDQLESTNVNVNVFRLFSQYWTEVTYIEESNYDLTTRNINGNHWGEIYRDVLYDLQNAKVLVDGDAGKTAMISVLEVYAWQILVDTFGDIPYTQALQGKDNMLPSYDNDTDIYANLLVRIDAAINQLNGASSGFNAADIMYQGDMTKWKKFAQSLKLKLAMRIADVNNTAAKAAAEQAYAGGLFTSNADNATIDYESANPNPIWTDLIQSGRNDFVVANTIIDYMNTLSDPRRSKYFADNLGAGTYVGGTYGDFNNFSTKTHVADLIQTQTFRGVIMDYAEIEFLLAEAAERGYVVGANAETHYNNAINASMADWGVSSTAAASYLADPAVAYTTASGTWKQKIGFQFWLAMYNRGFEGWCIYRKYDAPVLNVAADSGDPVPNRYTYPISEQTLNVTNWTAASTAIGGDTQATKVFWDVN